jgi:hypothetical protein
MIAIKILFLLAIKSNKMLHKNQSFMINTKASNTYTCPSDIPDNTVGDACATAYEAVITAATPSETVTWVEATVTDAVNAFIKECSGTKCVSACQTQAKAKPLASDPGDYKTTFKACEPVDPLTTTIIIETDCAKPEANSKDCDASYTKVIEAITAEAGWVAATIQGAINTYIAECTTTKCVKTCTPVISGVNVALKYTNLETQFKAQCNPNPPPPPAEGSSLKTKKANILLLLIFSILMSIQLHQNK